MQVQQCQFTYRHHEDGAGDLDGKQRAANWRSERGRHSYSTSGVVNVSPHEVVVVDPTEAFQVFHQPMRNDRRRVHERTFLPKRNSTAKNQCQSADLGHQSASSKVSTGVYATLIRDDALHLGDPRAYSCRVEYCRPLDARACNGGGESAPDCVFSVRGVIGDSKCQKLLSDLIETEHHHVDNVVDQGSCTQSAVSCSV